MSTSTITNNLPESLGDFLRSGGDPKLLPWMDMVAEDAIIWAQIEGLDYATNRVRRGVEADPTDLSSRWTLELLADPDLLALWRSRLSPDLVAESDDAVREVLDLRIRPYDITVTTEPGPYLCQGSGTHRVGVALVLKHRGDESVPEIALSPTFVLGLLGGALDHEEGLDDLSPGTLAAIRKLAEQGGAS